MESETKEWVKDVANEGTKKINIENTPFAIEDSSEVDDVVPENGKHDY